MTSRWANPINNNFLYDKEANLLPLGSVQFYGADGSTPLAVYSDPELTASLGSYIDADAFGLLPDFHMAAGTQYKMVAYDAIGGAGGAGAIKWTRDDVFGLDSSVDTRLDDIEASVASLENTGRNSIINGGCSAKNIDGDAAVIAAPSLTTSFAEGQAVGVRAKVANVTAGTQAIGYSADVASGAYLHLSGVTTNNAAATADAMFQVISGEACRFINQQATFRCKVYHDIGSAKDFTITVAVLNSRDDVSAYTTVLTGSASSVSDITWTSISLTVPDMGDCSNGIVVIVSGAVGTITTKNIRFTEAQFDIGGTLASFTETDPAIAEGALNLGFEQGCYFLGEYAFSGGSVDYVDICSGGDLDVDLSLYDYVIIEGQFGFNSSVATVGAVEIGTVAGGIVNTAVYQYLAKYIAPSGTTYAATDQNSSITKAANLYYTTGDITAGYRFRLVVKTPIAGFAPSYVQLSSKCVFIDAATANAGTQEMEGYVNGVSSFDWVRIYATTVANSDLSALNFSDGVFRAYGTNNLGLASV